MRRRTGCAAVVLLLAVAVAAAPASAQPARGSERVYLVALGSGAVPVVQEIAGELGQRLGITITVLPRLRLGRNLADMTRQQLVAEDVIAMLQGQQPFMGQEPAAVLIGITAEDLFIRGSDWRFAFGYRVAGRFAVISYARMDAENFGGDPDPALLRTRLRKMVLRYLGFLHYRLPESNDPRSVLARSLLGLQELDAMGEDF
jgi:predicted Zn-dependent protease